MLDLSYYLLIQALFDLLLLLLVVALLFQIRKLKKLPLDEAISRLQRAHELCERLSSNLEEKRLLSERLMAALETGAQAWERAREGGRDLKKEVKRLADQGLSVPEIAEKTGLQEGEVALILSVAGKK